VKLIVRGNIDGQTIIVDDIDNFGILYSNDVSAVTVNNNGILRSGKVEADSIKNEAYAQLIVRTIENEQDVANTAEINFDGTTLYVF
jgi:hypothetical protein